MEAGDGERVHETGVGITVAHGPIEVIVVGDGECGDERRAVAVHGVDGGTHARVQPDAHAPAGQLAHARVDHAERDDAVGR